MKKCDCIVGYDFADYGLSDLVFESAGKERGNYGDVEISFCPDCGKKLTKEETK